MSTDPTNDAAFVPPTDPTPPTPASLPAPNSTPVDPLSLDISDSPHLTPGTIIAGPGTYFRRARWIMVILMLCIGGWLLYDGLIGYPKGNREYIEKARAANNKDDFDSTGKFVGKLPHGDTDIRLQFILGIPLFPAALFFLWYFHHQSRGTYTLEGDQLSIPGHPPFHFADITKLDKKLWDRKGIAFLEYKTAAGQTGRARLDDFVYDRKPTDIIFYRAVLTRFYSAPENQPALEAAYWVANQLALTLPAEKIPAGGLDELAHRMMTDANKWKEAQDTLAKKLDPTNGGNDQTWHQLQYAADLLATYHATPA